MEHVQSFASWWHTHGVLIWASGVLVGVPLGTWLAWRWAGSRGGLRSEPVQSAYIVLGATGLVFSALTGLGFWPLYVWQIAAPWSDEALADIVQPADLAVSGLSVAVLLTGFAVLVSIWRRRLPIVAHLTPQTRTLAAFAFGLAALSWVTPLMDAFGSLTMADWVTAPASSPHAAYLARFGADPAALDAWARIAWLIEFVVWNEITQMLVAALALIAGYRIVTRLAGATGTSPGLTASDRPRAFAPSAHPPDGPRERESAGVSFWVRVAWTLPIAGLVLSGLEFALHLVTTPITNGLLRLSGTGSGLTGSWLSGLGESAHVPSAMAWPTSEFVLWLVALAITVRAFPRPALAWLHRPEGLTGGGVGAALLAGSWALAHRGVGGLWGPAQQEWSVRGLVAVGLDQLMLATPGELITLGLVAAFALWALRYRP